MILHSFHQGRRVHVVLLDCMIGSQGEKSRGWSVVGHTSNALHCWDRFARHMFGPHIPSPSLPNGAQEG